MLDMPPQMEVFLGLTTEIPRIYLHENPSALQQHACVNSAAVAYYDGDIHVSPAGNALDGDLPRSLSHEFAHHSLLTHGVSRPIWLQEGAAMLFAKESWHGYKFVDKPIPLSTMVEAFAHTSKREQAEAFYLQAYAMTLLLRESWRGHGTSERDLVAALLEARTTPEELFGWAIRQRTGKTHRDPLNAVYTYVQNGFRLDPD